MDKPSKLYDLIKEETGLDTVNSNTTVEDLKLDSLEFIELILRIQDKFNCQITDEQVAHISTVGDIEGLL